MRVEVCFEQLTDDGTLQKKETLAAYGAEDAIRVSGWSGPNEYVHFRTDDREHWPAELKIALDRKVLTDLYGPHSSLAFRVSPSQA